MSLTDEQRARLRAALAPILPQLARSAPVERQQLIRQALERAQVELTWAEWAAYEPDFLDLHGLAGEEEPGR